MRDLGEQPVTAWCQWGPEKNIRPANLFERSARKGAPSPGVRPGSFAGPKFGCATRASQLGILREASTAPVSQLSKKKRPTKERLVAGPWGQIYSFFVEHYVAAMTGAVKE